MLRRQPDKVRRFHPVSKPEIWNENIDISLAHGLAEMVTIESLSFPDVTEAVLFNYDYMKLNYINERKDVDARNRARTRQFMINLRVDLQQQMSAQGVRHQQQMSAHEARYQQQMSAQEARYQQQMQEHMSAQGVRHQQQMSAHEARYQQQMQEQISVQSIRHHQQMRSMEQQMQQQMRYMQLQFRTMRSDMKAEMKAYTAELRSEITQLEEKCYIALSHCRGMRKIAPNLVTGIYCALCNDEEVPGYCCQSCTNPVCLRCFPMAFQERVQLVDSFIDYRCPYCNRTFASFPEVSIDVEEHKRMTAGNDEGLLQQDTSSSEEEEDDDEEETSEEESDYYEESLRLSEDLLQLFYNY